jgi:hypothetical protein
LHENQIVLGFSVWVIPVLTPDLRSRLQQFPAAAGVFHMDNLFLSVNFHMGNKPIGPGQKPARYDVLILHKLPQNDVFYYDSTGMKKWQARALDKAPSFLYDIYAPFRAYISYKGEVPHE